MVEDILVSTDKGIITESDLDRVIEEYIDKLPNGEMIYKNVQCFNGLIRFIGNRLVKNILPNTRLHDYKLYDSIWDNIYLYVCNMYGYIPNIQLFCTSLIYINPNNVYGINENNNINYNGQVVNKDRLDVIKKWQTDRESALVGQVEQNNGIGAMFMLKAKFGYSENNTIRIESAVASPKLTVDELEQIAETANDPLELPET